MNNAVSNIKAVDLIMAQLKKELAPFDAKLLESTTAWALSRKAAIKEFKSSDEYKVLRHNSFALYAKLHAQAGGKTWYATINENSVESLVEAVKKHCLVRAEARNATITSNLLKNGIESVQGCQFAYSNDGFNGIFTVNTDAGVKRVKIDTIFAGGYNIQCAHLRVLVKVK